MSALVVASCGPGLDEGEHYAMPVAVWRADFEAPGDDEEWVAVDRCNERWAIDLGIMVQSSNCANSNNPVPETRLGTMLVRDDVPFDTGWLAAYVYSGDLNAIGLGYGESIHDMLRVRVDLLDRVVALEHLFMPPYRGVTVPNEPPSMEVLAIAKDVDLPHRRWYWLAVRREGDVHEVWIEGEKMIEATLSLPETEVVGLYSYGNVDARFDWVAIFSLDHTPWEPLP